MNLFPSYQEGTCCHTDRLHCQWMSETSISVQICPELLIPVQTRLRCRTLHRVCQDSALLKPGGLCPETAVCYFKVCAVLTCGSSCWLKLEFRSSGVYICNGGGREKNKFFSASWYRQSSDACVVLQSASYIPDSLRASMESVHSFWARTQQNWGFPFALLKNKAQNLQQVAPVPLGFAKGEGPNGPRRTPGELRVCSSLDRGCCCCCGRADCSMGAPCVLEDDVIWSSLKNVVARCFPCGFWDSFLIRHSYFCHLKINDRVVMRAVLLKPLSRTGVPGGFCLFPHPYAALPGVIPFSRNRSKPVDSRKSPSVVGEEFFLR